MKKILPVLLLAALVPCFFVLYEVFLKITPGMTRADLLTAFRAEGGVYTRAQRQFVYRRWPPFKNWRFIKVDVKFDSSEQKTKNLVELPTDKITWISKPYFQWGVYD